MMPALKVSPYDTALTASPLGSDPPVAAYRRLSVHPELTSHSLLVLTLDHLYLAPLAGDPKPETVAAAGSGADLDAVLGPLATVVELSAVTRLKLDLIANSLAVETIGAGMGTSRVTLTFATPQAADAFFTRIWRRVGNGLKLAPYARDSWALARGPLLMLAATLLLTAVLVLITSLFEDMAVSRGAGDVNAAGTGQLGVKADRPQSPLELLLGYLNWQTVCGIGGTAASASQIWLYRRLTSPPLALELTRG